MAKQLNQATVNLAFTADANQAKREIQSLQQSLNKLATVGAGPKGSTGLSSLTVEAQKAMVAAAELQASLESAVNVNTGKLDLTKFNESLKRSNKTLNDYAVQLSGLGPQGQQAFMQLTQAIVKSEAPLIRLNGKMKEFATSIANTARWQLSSSIIHWLMGGLQQAFGYAQDLNHSLNDIRIVTGQSVDQMKAFAAEANRSAKALSATTNEYAKASLIYYQQGLSDKQVKERTDITIKMANAAGVDAQTASDQLTAIWNNFAKNGKNLEYYADVITALGAATASSSDEISQGLEKFAAVSESVGLSYEYATSALATVTATTRQSADVVGNAFKTLFARIQGLNLGETLDDGTTLNKYSAALAQVGINIKDQSGQLKEMDTILDEMGAKWGTLNKDQQVALAQTVAGVRQYNQLIALMDNWDTFEVNLKIAEDSSGTLQKQQDIYAESWEAARDRVRTAAEDIYDSLLNDEAFIDILNGIEKVITALGGMIDGLGGLRGLLTSIGAVAFNIFNKEISNGIRNTVNGMKMLTPKGKAQVQNQKAEALNAAEKMIQSNKGSSQEAQAQSAAMQRELTIQKTLLANEKNLTDEQKKAYQIRLDSLRALEQQNQALAKQVDLLEAAAARSSLKLENQRAKELQAEIDADPMSYINSNTIKTKDLIAAYGGKENLTKEYNNFLKETNQAPAKGQIYSIQKMFNDKSFLQKAIGDGKFNSFIPTGRDLARQETMQRQETAGKIGRLKSFQSINKDVITGLERRDGSAQISKDYFNQIKTTYESAAGDLDGLADPATISNINEIIESLKKLDAAAEEGTLSVEELAKALKATDADNLESAIQGVEEEFLSNYTGDNYDQAAKEIDAAAQRQNLQNSNLNLNQTQDDFINDIQSQGVQNLQAWENKVTAVSGAIMALGATISAVQGVIDVFNDPDATVWDKITAILGALVGVVPALMSGFTGLATTFGFTMPISISKSAFAFTGLGAAGAAAGKTAQLGWGWIGLIMIAITALIAGVAAANKYLKETSPEGKLETLRQTTDDLTESNKQLKESFDKIRTSFDAYDTAVDKLNNCVKGTKEWKDALQEVNETAIQTISSLPSKYLIDETTGKATYKRDEVTGQIKFNPGVQENIEADLNKAEAVSGYALNVSETDTSLQEAKVDLINANKEVLSDYYKYKDPYLGDIIAQINAEEIFKNPQEWLNLTDTEFGEKLKELGDVATLSSDELETYQEAVQKGCLSIIAANEKMDLIAEMQVEQILGDKYSEETKDLASEMFEVDTTDAKKEIETRLNNEFSWATGSGAKAYTDLVKDLQNAGYANYSAASGNVVKGFDDNRKFVFYDEEQDKEVERTEEWVVSVLAAQAAIEGLGASAEQAKETLTNLTKFEDNTDNALGLAKWITSEDLSHSTQSQRDEFGKTVADEKTVDRATQMGFTAENDQEEIKAVQYLTDAFGSFEALESYAEETGTTVKQLALDLAEDIEGANEKFSSIPKDFLNNQVSSLVQDLIDGGSGKNLSNDTISSFGKIINEAYNELGSEGAKSVADYLGKMGEESEEFADELAKIDWQTTDLHDFKSILISLDPALVKDEQAVENLYAACKEAAPAIDGLAAAIDNFSNIQTVIDKIADGKNQISSSEYDTLVPSLKEFFTMGQDGLYYLTESAADFLSLAKEEQVAPYKEAREDLQSQVGNIVNALNPETDAESLDEYYNTLANTPLETRRDPYSLETSKDTLQQMLDYLVALGPEMKGLSEEDALAYQSNIDDGSLTYLQAYDLKTLFKDAGNQYEVLKDTVLPEKQAELQQSYDAEAVQAGSLSELQATGFEESNPEAYAKGLNKLGNEYASCKDELEEYNKALEEHGKNNKETQEAQEKLKLAIEGVEWGQLSEKVTEFYDNFDKNATLEEQEKQYEDLAKQINKTFNTKVQKNFIKDNEKLLKVVKNGTKEQKRSAIATLEVLANMDDNLQQAIESGEDFGDAFTGDEVQAKYQQLTDYLNSNPITVNAETGEIDFTELYAQLFGMCTTVEELEQLLWNLTGTKIDLAGMDTNGTVPKLIALAQELKSLTPHTTEWAVKMAEFEKALSESGVGVALDEADVPKSLGGDMAPETESVTGPASGGGGSGGGSGGDLLEPKHNKDEIERYHEIKNTLEDLEREYERLKTARERAYGMTKVGLINQEIEKTKELAEAQKQYMTEINDNLVDDRKALEAFGATFDERGNINNYDSLVAGWVKEFNAVRTEAADEAYQEKMDALKQYEETHDLWEDEYDQLIEYYNQIVDLSLEAVVVEVEFKIELSEKEVERIEYQLDKLSRSRTLNLDIQINKIGDYIPEYIEQSKVIREGIEKIYAESRKYGLTELTQDQWDQVNEWQSQLLELNTTVLDLITEVEDKLSEAIGSLGERFDEAEGRFDSYLGVLEHFNDVMELTGLHTKEFATYEALLQQRLDTTSEKINNNKKELDTYNAALAEAKDMLARAVVQGDEENILFWEEKVRELEIMTEEAYEAFISSWKDTVEAATEFFESKVEAIIQSFKDNIFSDGLDSMADKLDKVNDVRERYLDDITRWYELSKLNRELEKSIDDTDNLSAKRRLAEFQKEVLEYQKEGVEMSEYELNHTRARYELLLAEIALEEARNAKNQVQLKRDSEGNWGYVYTADKDAIAEAEQNYEDKLFEMKEAAIEYKEEMESTVIEAMTNMFNELSELDSTAADYQEKAWGIYQFYYEKLQYLAVEFDMALANSNQTLADTVFADEGIMTDFLTYINGIMEEAKEAPAELIKQYEWLQDTIRDANEQAGIDTDNFSGDVIVNIDWVGDKTQDLAQDMDTYTEEIRQSIIKVMQTTQSWKEAYLSAIKEMMAANETWNLASYEIPDGYNSWEDYYKDHPSEIDWDWKPTYTGKADGEYRGYMWADVIPVLSSGGSGGSGGT